MFPDRINPELEQGTAQNRTNNEVRVDRFVRAVFVIVTKSVDKIRTKGVSWKGLEVIEPMFVLCQKKKKMIFESGSTIKPLWRPCYTFGRTKCFVLIRCLCLSVTATPMMARFHHRVGSSHM